MRGSSTFSPRRVLFLCSGAVPLLGLLGRPADPMLLLYTCFVAAFFFRARIAVMVDRLPGPPFAKFLGSFLVVGALTETLAWANNYLKAAPNPALFHPQLLADLVIGLGFYGGWAVAWWLVCRRYRFTLAEAFVLTGLQGILFEQLGAVFLVILNMLPANPVQAGCTGLYVFAVHGSIVGLALVPWWDRLGSPAHSRSGVRYLVVVLLMVGLAFVGSFLAGLAALPFGGLPPKRPITEHPFW